MYLLNAGKKIDQTGNVKGKRLPICTSYKRESARVTLKQASGWREKGRDARKTFHVIFDIKFGGGDIIENWVMALSANEHS